MTDKMAILCVDDERIVLNSLETQLRNHFGDKYLLEFAENADEGFDVLDDLFETGATVLVVISDWLMPGMRGDEFLIKVHKLFPKIINIMLTGHADPVAVQNAKENADLYECVCKPWNAQCLIKTITSALEGNGYSCSK